MSPTLPIADVLRTRPRTTNRWALQLQPAVPHDWRGRQYAGGKLMAIQFNHTIRLRATAGHPRSFWPRCSGCRRRFTGDLSKSSRPRTAPTSTTWLLRKSPRSTTRSWSVTQSSMRSSAASASASSPTGLIPAGAKKGEINHHDGGRGVYFEEINGHLLEVITRPYGSGGWSPRARRTAAIGHRAPLRRHLQPPSAGISFPLLM